MHEKCWVAPIPFGLLVSATFAGPPAAVVIEYPGLCNASAAVALDGGRFLVADDEDTPTTLLRVYRVGHSEGPLSALPLPNDALELDPSQDLEVDIEGAARVGDCIYWIGSHSANKNGKPRPNRRRLLATRVKPKDSQVQVEVVGQPYKRLIEDLDEDRDYSKFGLKEAGQRAPKKAGALSIEGLAATPDGDLLIGFRNPVPGGKALIAKLKNPKGVTDGKPAKFGVPIRLDLGPFSDSFLDTLAYPISILCIANDHLVYSPSPVSPTAGRSGLALRESSAFPVAAGTGRTMRPVG